MTLWPGEIVEGDGGKRFKIERLVAYQGRDDCQDARCRRSGFHQREDGSWEMGECIGWHCSLCDKPCSSMGHNCPRAGEVPE